MAKTSAQLKHKSYQNGHGQNGHAVGFEVRLEQAVKLIEARRFKEADAICLAVIEHNPHNLDAFNLLGVSAKDNGEFERAVQYFHQALTIDPTYVRGLFNLANLMREHGYANESNELYESILIHEPQHARALSSLSIIKINAGHYAEALFFLRKLIAIIPNDSKIWSALAKAAEHALDGDDDELEGIVTTGLNCPAVEQEYVLRCAVKLINTNNQTSHFMSLVGNPTRVWSEHDWLAFKQEIHGDKLLSVLQKPLIQGLLKTLPIPQAGMENLLRNVRHACLELTIDNALNNLQISRWSPFLLNLAAQCFLNEYIYNVTDVEKTELVKLSTIVENEKNFNEKTLWNLALLACYQPIYNLGNSKDWEQLKDAEEISAEWKSFLLEQITNPLVELQIRKEIQTIGQIDDQVSQAVQAQYEENPYPRWKNLAPFSPMPVTKILNHLFPEQPTARWKPSTAPEILIAGCGTGKHALVSATRFANSNVLAIDLSKSSLAYAIRKTREYNNKNITFRQADILQLGSLDEKFDIVESVGVLHHMQNPQTGWQILVDLLKPKGLMRIGLYSEIARKAVVEGRAQVQNNNYSSDLEGIRKLRMDIFQNQYSKTSSILLRAYDFYSSSECRDLLFHVQEHRFTIPQIKQALQDLGLDFLGFEDPNPELFKHYAQMFPEDKTMNNLDNWQIFEETHPLTFAGMYQFWLQKK